MYTVKKDAKGILRETHYAIPPEKLPEGEVEGRLPGDPVSVYFADALTLKNGAVAIDMEKAREIHAENLRQLCDERLGQIDQKTPRATREYVITGDKSRVDELESQAVALRAVRANPGLDTIHDAETLAAYLPAILR